MHVFAFLVALALAGLVLWEIFETIILPRKIDRRFRLTRLAPWTHPPGAKDNWVATKWQSYRQGSMHVP